MLIQPLPAVLRGVESFTCRTFFLLCNLSLSWCNLVLIEHMGNNSSFSLFCSFFTWEDGLSSSCQSQIIQFFCPFFVFLVVQHDPHSIPWLLTHISGARFPCWSPGLAMPTSLSSTPQLWGIPLDSSFPAHCRSLGCWRALWWTHPSHFWLSCSPTLVLSLYLPTSYFCQAVLVHFLHGTFHVS